MLLQMSNFPSFLLLSSIPLCVCGGGSGLVLSAVVFSGQ